MANLGSISTFNINGNELTVKDPVLTNIVSQIVEAIGANNNNIAERINDLHSRSFDYTIKISSNNDSELANIQDGIYKIQYVTITGEGDNVVETLTNSAILIQTGINQYRYKDGQLSSRTKTNDTWSEWIIISNGGSSSGVTSFNGETGAITYTPPVISVNGQTGAVVLDLSWGSSSGVTSFNGETGAITYTPPVTSVNGATGTVVTSLSSNYATATGINTELQLASGDTYEEAFGKLEKSIMDDEETIVAALVDLNTRINNISEAPVTSVNGATGAVTIDIPVTSVNGMTGAVVIPEGGVTSFNGETGAVTYTAPVTSVNGETGAVTVDPGVTSFNGATGAVTYTAPVISVNGETGAITVNGLPSVTSADNGKILMVVNGTWTLVSPSVLYSGSGVPNNAQGNNGDIYMQI